MFIKTAEYSHDDHLCFNNYAFCPAALVALGPHLEEASEPDEGYDQDQHKALIYLGSTLVRHWSLPLLTQTLFIICHSDWSQVSLTFACYVELLILASYMYVQLRRRRLF